VHFCACVCVCVCRGGEALILTVTPQHPHHGPFRAKSLAMGVIESKGKFHNLEANLSDPLRLEERFCSFSMQLASDCS